MFHNIEIQYLHLLQRVLDRGEWSNNRTGIRTKSVFGVQFRHNLQDGVSFPILTTRKIPWKHSISEMLFFLSGSTDIRDLWKSHVKFWDANYNSNSWKNNPHYTEFSLGKSYGYQMRNYNGYYDQITYLLDQLVNNPTSRRLIVDLWNPAEIDETCLPPCHYSFQLCVHPQELHDDNYDNFKEGLSLHLTIRSSDLFLGFPANCAQYAALLLMFARVTNRKAREIIITLGNAHIYENHFDAVKKQLNNYILQLPSMMLEKKPFFDYIIDDFLLNDYNHAGKITAEVAV